jgi:hypothetical protein
VSGGSVSENLIGESGVFDKDGVLTISTTPKVKTVIKDREMRTARFATGVWTVAGKAVPSGEVQVIEKGNVKVCALANADGTLTLAKAEGSGKGSVSIEYTLNGQAKASNGNIRFKSKVYKAKVKVQ